MTLLGGGAIFAWHSHHSQAQQTSSLAVFQSTSQKQVKRLPQTSLNNRVPKRLTRLQAPSSKVRVLHRRQKHLLWMWKPFEMVCDFQASSGDWVSDGGHVRPSPSQGSQNRKTGSTADGKTVVKDFNGQPMFLFFATMVQGWSILLCLCQPIKQHRLRTILSKT